MCVDSVSTRLDRTRRHLSLVKDERRFCRGMAITWAYEVPRAKAVGCKGIRVGSMCLDGESSRLKVPALLLLKFCAELLEVRLPLLHRNLVLFEL